MSVEENKSREDKWADHTFLCTSWAPLSRIPSRSPTPLFWSLSRLRVQLHRVGLCGKKKKKGTSARSRSVPRCSMRSVLEPASQIHDCMTAAPLKIRHVSCDVWLLLDKLSAGILFILLGTQPQRVKKAKLSMLSMFCWPSVFTSSEHVDAGGDSHQLANK